MNIIFKHKKTGIIISREQIIHSLNNDNCERFTFMWLPPVLPFEDKRKELEKVEVVRYTYHLKDIPVSEDFEAIVEDMDFTMEDLREMYYSVYSKDLREKIYYRFEKQQEMEREV